MQENIENNSINIERIIDRFDKYMFIRRLNDNKVTNDLHFSVGTISKSRKIGRDLSRISIEKILNFYKDLDPVWLKVGIGTMLKEPDNEIKNKNMKTPEIPEEKNEVRIIKKPKKPVTQERLKKLEESRKRMQEVVDDFQMNVSELERHLKISHGSISNVLDKRNVIRNTVAKPLNRKFGYGYEWLMYGIGPRKTTKRTYVKAAPVEKIESTQLERIIKLLEENIENQNKTSDRTIKLLEEKIEDMKTIERRKRFGGSGTIPKTTTKTARTKPTG